MRVLVVGGGGREHALCWKIAASPLCEKLFCAPGNAGIAREAECVPIGAEDLDAQVAFATDNAIDFVVVGPEATLGSGLVDALADAGSKASAQRPAAPRRRGRGSPVPHSGCRPHQRPASGIPEEQGAGPRLTFRDAWLADPRAIGT